MKISNSKSEPTDPWKKILKNTILQETLSCTPFLSLQENDDASILNLRLWCFKVLNQRPKLTSSLYDVQKMKNLVQSALCQIIQEKTTAHIDKIETALKTSVIFKDRMELIQKRDLLKEWNQNPFLIMPSF